MLKIESPKTDVNPGTVIHIRRSDFKTSKCHELLSMDYYRKQLQGMPKPWTVVTDDPKDAFVLSFLQETGAQLQSATGPHPDVDEFWFLQNHDFIVMSNSTFAWWATRFALDRNPNVVIRECPKFLKDPKSQIPFF